MNILIDPYSHVRVDIIIIIIPIIILLWYYVKCCQSLFICKTNFYEPV